MMIMDMNIMRSSRVGLLIALATAAPLLAGCTDPSGADETRVTNVSSKENSDMTNPAATSAFLLPVSAKDVESHEETGQDQLVLVAFQAPSVDAEAFAAKLIPAGVKEGRDPGLAYLGKGKVWWLTDLPQGASGGEHNDPASGEVTKLVIGPNESGQRRVWAARFSL